MIHRFSLLPSVRLALCLLMVGALVLNSRGAEKRIEWVQSMQNGLGTNFTSKLSGEGKPGEWKIVLDDAPSVFTPLTPGAPSPNKRPVLAQVSQDPTDERFPLLVYEGDTFGDFTLSTRVKAMEGKTEQMAGIAFRIQDEKNYYVVRTSSLGNTFRFYKFVDGVRSEPIGPDTKLPAQVWHELQIECKKHQIKISLNGKQVIPDLEDKSFLAGKIGFWTKSDSVSYFADTLIRYTPREPFAQTLVKEILQANPRLVDLRVFALPPESKDIKLIAARETSEVGQLGTEIEQNVMERGLIYYGRGRETAIVTLPLRDNNGETIAAVRVVLRAFKGQTENTAIARATPFLKLLASRVTSSKELQQGNQ